MTEHTAHRLQNEKEEEQLGGDEELSLFPSLYLINNNDFFKELKVSVEENGWVLTQPHGHFDVRVPEVLQPSQVLLLQWVAWGDVRFHLCFIIKLSFFSAIDLI